MKYLTPIYSTLMQAFEENALKNFETQKYCERIALMQEYGTLRLDAGRQTGKSAAAISFASDWLNKGNSVIYIGWNTNSSLEFKERLRNTHIAKQQQFFNIHAMDWVECKRQVFTFPSVREFLGSKTNTVFRGLSLGQVLVIIDEPCSRMPEIYKFYKQYEDAIKPATVSCGNKLPLFFVLGIQ